LFTDNVSLVFENKWEKHGWHFFEKIKFLLDF